MKTLILVIAVAFITGCTTHYINGKVASEQEINECRNEVMTPGGSWKQITFGQGAWTFNRCIQKKGYNTRL